MHRGGISPGRGGSRGQRHRRHDENGKSNFGDGHQRRGGHPSGLSGKDIGLWYARRGKQKKKELDIQNRSVVTMNKSREQQLQQLLSTDDPADEPQPSSSESDICREERERYANDKEGFYDVLLQDYGAIFVNDSQTVEDEFKLGHRMEYKDTQQCSLQPNAVLDQMLLKELEKVKSSEMMEFREKLPSYQLREQILETICNNQVCVISGETGCGKTTQVAQFILDDCISKSNGSTCHIVCTQPRRISAVSVAERVAEERGERLGKSCGFQIRLESKLPRRQGSILYCTTGILLQRLIGDPYLSDVSHIILDEIHERDLLSDFLLIIVKDILPYRPDLKIILMSATLNAEQFSGYFENCPMMHIPGFTFPVKEYFLEKIIDLTNYQPSFQQRPRQNSYGKKWRKEEDTFLDYLHENSHKYPVHILNAMENMDFQNVDYDLILAVINHICLSLGLGAILIFLPGWAQISKMHEILVKHRVYGSNGFILIPLHSQMPTANQKQIFDVPPQGVRKIVIATNIAETSVTIPDVVFVINSGKSKEKTYDVETDVSGLQPVWVSKASARQRRGRAGRVQDGYCFHLFAEFHWDNFEDYAQPEMLRTPLESLGLQIKILRLGMMKKFLLKAMESPHEKAIDNAIISLKRMGAFDKNENLTALGYHLARLPVAPKVGRMILFSAIFSCLDPVLTIAASLDFKEPFYIPIHKEREADQKRMELARGSHSDHIMIINAFEGWEDSRYKSNSRRYCWDYFLSETTLKMIENMKKQFAELLYDIGFVTSSNLKDGNANRFSRNMNLVKAVICAGLYPNVVKVEYGKNDKRPPKLYVEQYGRVFIHPKSVNEKVNRFESPWLIYHKLMKTTKLYVYDCSVVTPFALLFFGGEVRVHQEEGMDTISVDHGIKFHSPERIALLVKNLRRELDILLKKKIKNPQMQLVAGNESGGRDDQILFAIIELITNEKVKGKVELKSNRQLKPNNQPDTSETRLH